MSGAGAHRGSGRGAAPAPSKRMAAFMVALLAVGLALIARYLPRYLQRVSGAQDAQQQSRGEETGVKVPGPEDNLEQLRYDIYATVANKYPPTWSGSLHGEVEWASWSNESIVAMIEQRKPTAFHDSPARDWLLLEVDLWNLSMHIPNLYGLLHQEENPVMVVEDERFPGGMLGADVNATETNAMDVLPMWMFLYYVSDPSHFLLYSGRYHIWEWFAPGLQNSTTWNDYAIVEAIAEGTNITVNKTAPTVWLAHPGVVLQARYSEYHTFKIQLQGTTRFVLFPPEDIKHLYLYPSIHLRYRQSQVNFEAPDLEAFPSFAKAKGYEVVLKPGDSLYIPPFWMYRLEALTTSFMMNMQSPSQEQLALMEAYYTLLPFRNATEAVEDEKIVHAQVYLIHFISRVEAISSPRQFARALYRSRYQSLYPEDGLFIQSSDFNCLADREDEHRAYIKQMDRTAIRNVADFVADAVNDPGVPKAAKIVWAMDYVEQIARWAIGAEKAVLFIRECLRFEKVPVIYEEEGPAVMRFD